MYIEKHADASSLPLLERVDNEDEEEEEEKFSSLALSIGFS